MQLRAQDIGAPGNRRRPCAGGALLALAAAAALGALACARLAAADELEFGLEQNTLRRIELRGNETIPDAELKAILKIREPSWLHPLRLPRYRPDLIGAELRLLERYYRQHGFHQVQVSLESIASAPRGGGDIVTMAIVEGPRTILERLIFAGGDPLGETELRAGLRYVEGLPVPADLNDLGPDIYQLRSRYWDRGHLRVTITPALETSPGADPARRVATLTYSIDPGRAYRVGRVVISGNRLTRTELIARELKLAPGEPLRWDAVTESQRRLFDSALFRDVSLEATDLDTVAGVADLAVRVVERRPAYYEFGVGLGSRERLRGLLAWGHNNLWGTGQRLQVRSRLYLVYERIQPATRDRATPQLNYRFDVLHLHPHFLRDRFRLETNLYLEEQTRGESGLNLRTLGFTFGTQFRESARALHLVAAQVESAEPSLHPDAAEELREDFARNNIRKSATHSLNHSRWREGRDDLFRPTQGSLSTIQTELAGGPLGGDNSFVKGHLAWHGYARTPLGGVLALRAGFGAVRPYGGSLARGADGVPYQERFFAGGASTVRGYLEGSLGPQLPSAQLDSLQQSSPYVPLPDRPARGGNYLLLTNLEWRFPLPLLDRWKLGGVLFLDGGNVWQRWDDIRLRGFRLRSYPRDPQDVLATKLWDYRYSLGTGLRLDTPFGPFRFDVGFPLKRARLSETLAEDKVIYHFSLGYPF